MTTQIEPGCLNALIEKQAVKILDGSWALDGTDMHALFRQDHIPSAQFFDLEAISDHTSALPHMAPSARQFAEAMGAMGISESDHVVIYDRQGLFSAARVWWTFKLMGHDKVQILRGGLPAWKAAGLQVSADIITPVPTNYSPQRRDEKVMNLRELYNHLNETGYTILDARPKARFDGSAPEPRAGLRSGHMPGSRSLPFAELIREGALKPRAELSEILQAHGVHETDTVITTCGSGVTAAIISLALHETGHTSALLYDGSWAEWGQEALDTPVVKTESECPDL
ncbi:3-mercaptopyruvate sulfurtransferase [Asticcacaulis sp. MM231]|uniref:3-mercaptopyruvate sulfurtransferase n=1 Tax=Asticcacaulis sp. MM231 TaxID=3157666 RepID=UPI0032D588C1